MKAFVVATIALTSACSIGGSGGGADFTGLCKFASPPLTSGANARQMAADIQAALPKGYAHDAHNLAISKAAFKLMVAAGSAVPTSQEDQISTDLSLDTAVKAQIDLGTACA